MGSLKTTVKSRKNTLQVTISKGQTDAEIAHLIGKFAEEDGSSTLEALQKALHIIRGAYALL